MFLGRMLSFSCLHESMTLKFVTRVTHMQMKKAPSTFLVVVKEDLALRILSFLFCSTFSCCCTTISWLRGKVKWFLIFFQPQTIDRRPNIIEYFSFEGPAILRAPFNMQLWFVCEKSNSNLRARSRIVSR